ncbi:Intraflagellar transport protein 88 homolog [Aduncisulcus paluster]|uniref:Intraflagellar transport protein 88 homolog n=1 Tax=Aduncisulcus paluster TaxID=2918883 RepID=A0ABQ5KLG4_9EUKA|nr:Intraflagellar transport protein 88 homolog [Aduncisulcus paluster]
MPGVPNQAPPQSSRPMTAVRAAGYSSAGRPGTGARNYSSKHSKLPKKEIITREQRIRTLEARVHEHINACCDAMEKKDYKTAISEAQIAIRSDKKLIKEDGASKESNESDLTFSTQLCLAQSQEGAGDYEEAIRTYTSMLKHHKEIQEAEIRLHIGNLYFKLEKYETSIKMYRMGIDMIPPTHNRLRMLFGRNIGQAFMSLGQWSDAVSTLDSSSFDSLEADAERSQSQTGDEEDESPEVDFQSLYNLLICYYATGDQTMMFEVFSRLITADQKFTTDSAGDSLALNLAKQARERRRLLLQAARLIAPVCAENEATGFDAVSTLLRQSGLGKLASSLELAKASAFMHTRDFTSAESVLKTMERRGGGSSLDMITGGTDSSQYGTGTSGGDKAQSSLEGIYTNLSFLSLAKGDVESAEKHAESALGCDRYAPQALVNDGCVKMRKGEIEAARDIFSEAVRLSSDSVEAMYNLSLCHRMLGHYTSALRTLQRLNVAVPDLPSVVYLLGDTSFLAGQKEEAVRYLEQCVSLAPFDSTVHCRLGEIHSKMGDIPAAVNCMCEAERCDPSNATVLEWLSSHYISQEAYEQALPLLRRLSLLASTSTMSIGVDGNIEGTSDLCEKCKWLLLAASCERRLGLVDEATSTYDAIVSEFPACREALRHLVRLCNNNGDSVKAARYQKELDQAVSLAAKQEARVLMEKKEEPVKIDFKASEVEEDSRFSGRPTPKLPSRDDDIFDDDDMLGDDFLPE